MSDIPLTRAEPFSKVVCVEMSRVGAHSAMPQRRRTVTRLAGRAALVVGGSILTLGALQVAAQAAEPGDGATSDAPATADLSSASTPTPNGLLPGLTRGLVHTVHQATHAGARTDQRDLPTAVSTAVGGTATTVHRTLDQTAGRAVGAVTGKVLPGVLPEVGRDVREVTTAVGSSATGVVTPVVTQVVTPVATHVVTPVVRTATAATTDLVGGVHEVTQTTGTALHQVTHPADTEATDATAEPRTSPVRTPDRRDAETAETAGTGKTGAPLPVPVTAPAPHSGSAATTHGTRAIAGHHAHRNAPGAFVVPVIPPALELPRTISPDTSAAAAHVGAGAARVRIPPARAPASAERPSAPRAGDLAGGVVASAGERDRHRLGPALASTPSRAARAASYAGASTAARASEPATAPSSEPGHSPD